MMETATKDERVRARILHAAQKLMQQYGFNKLAMDDIARAVGKSKSSLYYYYTSKEVILESVFQHEANHVLRVVKAAVAAADTAEAKFRAFTLVRLQELQKVTNLYRLLTLELLENPHFTYRFCHYYDLRELQLMKFILDSSLANQEFTGFGYADSEAIACIVISSMRGIEYDFIIQRAALDGKKTVDVNETMKVMVEILIKGLKR